MFSPIDYLHMRVEQTRDEFIDARVALLTRYDYDPEKDARLTVFNKCTNVLGSVQLGFVFIIHHLRYGKWWQEKSRTLPDAKTIQQSVDQFEMFLRIGMIQFVFASIESSFRVYVRTLDPIACSNGTAEFKSIYEWLLSRLNLRRYVPLLDLMRNIRNSLHNNGLFFPRSGADETVVYKGKSYLFEVGEPNNFVTWDLILDLMPDIKSMLVDIVESIDMTRIRRINDPS